MRTLTTMAWRNLWRNRRRTVILLLTVALGVWSMLAVAALLHGWREQALNDAVQRLAGHVQVRAPAYWSDPSIEHSMPEPDGALRTLLDGDQVAAWTQHVRVPSVMMSESASAQTALVGIDPEAERGMSFIGDGVAQGRALSGAGDSGLVIGRRLAERLDTAVGRRVVVMTQDPDNRLVDRGFRVVGIFDAKLESTEEAFLFTGLKTAQGFLGLDGRISEIAIRPADGVAAGELAARAAAAAPALDVRPWKQALPLTAARLELIDGLAMIWLGVVVVAMAFGVVNTLIMAVTERAREFSLFQALGLGRRKLLGLVVAESLLLLVLGTMLGNAAAGLSILAVPNGIDLSAFARGAELTGLGATVSLILNPDDLLLADGLVLTLGVMAALYPAWWATRRAPADALRH